MTRLAVRLRRAGPGDAAALAALYRAARQWLLDRGNRQWRDEEFTAGALGRDIRRGRILVAAHGGRIVGAAYAEPRDPTFWPDHNAANALYVRRLVVSRRAASRCVADSLLAGIAAAARRRGRAYLRLDCAPIEPLARIYDRLGFRLVDQSTLGGYLVFRFERATAATRSGVGRALR